MTTQELYEDLQSGLLTHYDAGEAASISRIVLEDAFDLHLPLTEREIRPEEEQLYRHIRFRLMRGEPVQYILGEADFYGLKFRVDTRVLIPRQETEELVHWVLDSWKQAGKKPGLKILDIGTGSGCIPITLKKQAPVLEITGLDIESDILALAEENAIFNQVEVKWLQADILEESRWEELGSFDYIVSNPPYIPPSQQKLMPRHVLEHEPHLALFVPENDPLLFYREIGLFAFRNLLQDGSLFFEINEFYAQSLQELMRDIGFVNIETRQDIGGKDRMLRLRK
ncbi:MAG: peptide chain release factor N(5)-glutamine methyltransferase [Saprospiraceae bacterium]